MKIEKIFHRKPTAAEMAELREGAASARTIVLLSATPDKALAALKANKGIPFPVRLAACEGILECKSRAGRRTWPLHRWVDEALKAVMP